jgi:hypothetical protein
MNPEYPLLGQSQNPRPDQTYAEPWKEQPVKKANTRMKPEWLKSTVIPIIEDRKPEAKNAAAPGQLQSDTLTAASNV